TYDAHIASTAVWSAGAMSTDVILGSAAEADPDRGPQELRTCRRQGLPDRHDAGTSVRRYMPHGVRHPDGAADGRSRRRGPAAGTQARTIQMPQAPRTWIRAGDRRQPRIIGVPRTPAAGHAGGTPRQNRPSLRSSKRLPGTSV